MYYRTRDNMLLLIAVSFHICSTAIGTECTMAKESGFECDEHLPVTHFYFDTRTETICNIFFSGLSEEKPQKCANSSCDVQHSCVSEYCCPSKELICSQIYDSGHELNAASVKHVRRYAYNKDFGVCNRFSYFGKAGNFNNFPNWPSCMKFCARS
ncbi:Uncharacterized protein ZC84.1 [Toxocara canis]|uniref:Uncharacterized protein ZC84.1 n=1 Tax=Toxocara canis TaxID=6265 RepID=A0A0B2VEZ3_TOXCA|nr:Uncharacterized protein ZC84.1 [Toxocara canis]